MIRLSSLNRRFAVVALLLLYAPFSARAEWTSRVSEVVRGGVVVGGIGLESTTTTPATGNIRMQIPRGARVRSAWLYSSVYNFNAGQIPRIAEHPRYVQLGGTGNTVIRNLEGNGDRQTRETASQFRRRPTYHLFVTNVTDNLRTLVAAAEGPEYQVPIEELGDDAEASNVWISGHALVVVFEHDAAPPRVVLVAEGATAVPHAGVAPAYSQSLRLAAPLSYRCNAGQPGYDPAVLSVAVALDLADCDETTTLRVGNTVLGTRVGGADDMSPAATGVCFETGGAGLGALYAVGNLGADARAMPVGYANDSLQNTGGRADDELFDISRAMPTGAATLDITVIKDLRRPGDVTDIPLLVFQGPADTLGDADEDGARDDAETICLATDSDRDGIPDYLDRDSDNDCAADNSEQERGSARTQASSSSAANCSDGNDCTIDACNRGGCGHNNSDRGARCSGGVCDGNATPQCVACLASENCGGSTPHCDTHAQQCVACLQDVHCNDGNACTSEVCRAGACVPTTIARNTRCPQGLCNGSSSAPMCVQCLADMHCPRAQPRCDQTSNTCGACNADAQCDDRNPCTVDHCGGGTCTHASQSAGTRCGGSNVCDGAATNPACVTCVSDAQCSGNTSHCDTQNHRCVACLSVGDCNDNNECTEDSCTRNVCGNAQRAMSSTCSGGYCNSRASCVQCITPAHCNDQNDCTTDLCNSGACSSRSVPRGSACAGGVCNGDAEGPMCVACVSDASCSGATPRCNTAASQCLACVVDAHCDDHNTCTNDSCAAGACRNESQRAGATCAGGVCDGASTPACVACISNAQCSGRTAQCDTASHRCAECLQETDCADQSECTEDRCNAGVCSHPLLASGSRCAAGYCDVRGACTQCLTANHCDDNNSCTVDACALGRCASRAAPVGSLCAGGVCSAGDAPMCVACTLDSHCSGSTPHCELVTHACRACTSNAHCDDHNACTQDSCGEGFCHNNAAANGTTCASGVCSTTSATSACVACIDDSQCRGATAHCNVEAHACRQCVSATHCDDGNPCTVDGCGANGACTHTPTAAGSTCATGVCNGRSACVACVDAAQCDDQNACSVDTCALNRCVHRAAAGGTPCASGVCSVARPTAPSACVACASDAQCSAPSPRCNTQAGSCVACLSVRDCDDGNASTRDRCDANQCVHVDVPARVTTPTTN